MMTAAEYVSNIVEPTLEEFRQNRTDLRRGMLASMAVLHVVDFVMQNRKATAEAGDAAAISFKDEMRAKHPSFYAVDLFGRASKHGALRKVVGFDTDKHRVLSHIPPMIFGLFSQSPDILVELPNGSNTRLLIALDETMAMYRTEFPEAFL